MVSPVLQYDATVSFVGAIRFGIAFISHKMKTFGVLDVLEGKSHHYSGL